MSLKLVYQNILSLAQRIKEPFHVAGPCRVTLAHEKRNRDNILYNSLFYKIFEFILQFYALASRVDKPLSFSLSEIIPKARVVIY